MGKHKLPDWIGVSKQIDDGIEIGPVAQFIYDYEPPQRKDATKFRKSLQKIINSLTPKKKKSRSERTKPEKTIRRYNDKMMRGYANKGMQKLCKE